MLDAVLLPEIPREGFRRFEPAFTLAEAGRRQIARVSRIRRRTSSSIDTPACRASRRSQDLSPGSMSRTTMLVLMPTPPVRSRPQRYRIMISTVKGSTLAAWESVIGTVELAFLDVCEPAPVPDAAGWAFDLAVRTLRVLAAPALNATCSGGGWTPPVADPAVRARRSPASTGPCRHSPLPVVMSAGDRTSCPPASSSCPA